MNSHSISWSYILTRELQGGDKGGYKIQIQKQAEMQVHNAVLANRARQLRHGSKFKAAGNTVKNAQR